jgi:hypothetical protein
MKLVISAICAVSLSAGCQRDNRSRGVGVQRGAVPDVASRNGKSAVRQFEVTALLDRSGSEGDAAEALSKVVIPGQRAEDWICKVEWTVFRESSDGSAFKRSEGMPPVYELLLMLPDKALGSQVGFFVLNYDLKVKKYTVPNAELQKYEDGDWVMISGVVRDGTRVSWEEAKQLHWLQLGRLTLTRIEKLQK